MMGLINAIISNSRAGQVFKDMRNAGSNCISPDQWYNHRSRTFKKNKRKGK